MASLLSNPVVPRMEKTPFVGKVTVRYMITRLLKPALSWYVGGRRAERKMQPGKYSLRNQLPRLIALLRTFYVMHVFLVFSYTS